MDKSYQLVLKKRVLEELKNRQKDNPNYSQKQFAEDMDISESTFTQIKNCERNPSLESAYSIAKALNCSLDWLVKENVPKNSIPNDEDISIHKISKYIGLNDIVIRYLHCLANENTNVSKEKIQGINSLFNCLESFESFILDINEYLKFNKYKYENGYLLHGDSIEETFEKNNKTYIKLNKKYGIDDMYEYSNLNNGIFYFDSEEYMRLFERMLIIDINEIKRNSQYEKEYVSERLKEVKAELKNEKDKNRTYAYKYEINNLESLLSDINLVSSSNDRYLIEEDKKDEK